jgi:hypothetical protein
MQAVVICNLQLKHKKICIKAVYICYLLHCSFSLNAWQRMPPFHTKIINVYSETRTQYISTAHQQNADFLNA